MQELRFVAVSEDGSYAVLAVPGRSGRFMLPIDERLRAVAQDQTSRLAQYEIEVESPLRPKEIQARIRAGETAEEIADAAGIPVERVRWFEGPVLAERGYIADQAQAASVRRAGDSAGPGPRLGDIVTARLSAAGSDPADGQWDSRKRGDGSWQVSLTFPSGGRLHVAEWVFDPRRRHVMPDDDNAARLSLPESELPQSELPAPMPGEATVTPIASRLGAAAGMGGGGMGGGGFGGGPGVSSRFRPDRSVIPDRSLGADRSLVDRPVTERPVIPAAPAAASRDSTGFRDGTGSRDDTGYLDSAGFRGPVADPPAYRDPAPDQATPGRQAPAAQAPAAPAPDAPAVAPAAPAHQGPAFDDSERMRLTPSRPVVFEEPEPTLLAEQFERAPANPPAPPTQPSATPAPAPVAQAPSAAPATPVPATARVDLATVTPAAEATAPAEPASATAPTSPEVTALAPEPAITLAPVSAASAEVATAPKPTVAAHPAIREPDPVATQVRPSAPAEPVATTESTAPAAVQPAASAMSEPEAPATSEPEAEVPAPAEPPATEDQQNRQRQGAKKNAKARRSSVPSWDEIMLGSSRQRD
jgi:hypothetical protein